MDFFGSNVHRGLRFVREDEDYDSGSERGMEEDEDVVVSGLKTRVLLWSGCCCEAGCCLFACGACSVGR